MLQGTGLQSVWRTVCRKQALVRLNHLPAVAAATCDRPHPYSYSNRSTVSRAASRTHDPIRALHSAARRAQSSDSRGHTPAAARTAQSRSLCATAVLSAAAAAAAATAPASASAATAMSPMEVVRVPCLSDNYVWLLHEPTSGLTAVVDPAEEAPVVHELNNRGWTLNFILNTHHHMDHVGGNTALKRRFPGLTIVGPRADWQRIPGIDVQVGDGDTWRLGPLEFRVFDTPGHTRGHIAYWAPQAEALFPGDTLFALGCGRLFEGSPQQMWASLSKLLPLPDATRVYCAHEYTASNARFAVSVDPGNAALAERKARVDAARARGEATVPSLLGEEKATNPFLRPNDPAIRKQLRFDGAAADWEVFGAIRAAKDNF